jgi:hypothetical protein
MRRRAEIHKPGKVTKILHAPEVTVEQAEVEVSDAGTRSGKIRIVNFLSDRDGNNMRLSEGENVDVVISSDDVETD